MRLYWRAKLTGALGLGDVVMKGSLEKENGLVHRWRLTDIDHEGVVVVIIMPECKLTGAAKEHTLLERGS